ncbi:lig_chan-Glu_bd domain-containing protein [Trichonephila inaurata madagascariensis]|uniref:Lig_chan-Glu_bd domain-containing protein n=1 Tax=Trichonephila inaurata madagascariensis TaxID=2747483 RepID=A0A8X6XZ26_9ARAC|nr:lig_chan-Glu_bd domain-containing protein [Trichonephila inaurata madagascariensis]
MVESYLWPEKFSLSPSFDGYVMVVDLSRTEETFRQLLSFLKEKYMFGPHFRWIIGVNGCFHKDSILNLFDEGDRIVTVTTDNMESSTCRIHTFHTEFKVWGLHSIGNGSIDFRQKFLDKMNASSYLEETLFEEPFTDFGGRILKISSLGV